MLLGINCGNTVLWEILFSKRVQHYVVTLVWTSSIVICLRFKKSCWSHTMMFKNNNSFSLMKVHEYYLFYPFVSQQRYPLLTSRGVGYSRQRATQGYAPFTEAKCERPHGELAHNNTVLSDRMIWIWQTIIATVIAWCGHLCIYAWGSQVVTEYSGYGLSPILKTVEKI